MKLLRPWPDRYPSAPLGDLCEIHGGKPAPKSGLLTEPSSEGVPFIRMRDLGREHVSSRFTQFSDLLDPEFAHQNGYKKMPIGSILMPRSGSVALNHRALLAREASIVSHICALVARDSSVCDPEYLFRVLCMMDMRKMSTKTTGLDAISFSSLKKIRIPLPPLAEQKRIAGILDAADALRAKRRESIDQLDRLIQATFLEMFGDPRENPYKFARQRLVDFYIDDRQGTRCGPFGSALKKSEYCDHGVPVWNMDNIGQGGRATMPFRMWINHKKFEELRAFEVLDGDVLISRAGTVGKMCVALSGDSPSIISTNLIRVRFGPQLVPEFFVALMTYCKGRVGRLRTGPDGAFTHMSTKVLDSLEFPYPPIELQSTYRDFLSAIEAQREQLNNHFDTLDTLFASIQSRAFRGDL